MSAPLSTSLPSHFRVRPLSPPSLSRGRSFYRRDAILSDEAPAPAVDYSLAKTRLEVLQGWEVSFTVLSLYLASALALVYVLFKLGYVADQWDRVGHIPPLSAVEHYFRVILTAFSVLLPLFFAANLILYQRVTDEQIWTCALLAVGLLATNPLTANAQDEAPYENLGRVLVSYLRLPTRARVLSEAARASLIWNDAVYTAVVYLYLLLAVQSYRIFDIRNIHSSSFYLPKLAVACVYFLVKVVAGFKADVSLGLVPFTRLTTWIALIRSGRSSIYITVPVLVMTVMDAMFAVWLVREVAVTADFLATVPYMENRSKQLGFRCFVFQTLAFCFNMIGLSFIIMYMLPRSFLYEAFDDPGGHLFQLEPPVARLALGFVYFTWTLVLAYVNLPPRPVMPFAQKLMHKYLFMVRKSRVAAWFGLADIESTEDAEDSSDGEDAVDPLGERHAFDYGRSQALTSQVPPAIPFRYRHRESFDEAPILSAGLQQHPAFPRFTNSFSRREGFVGSNGSPSGPVAKYDVEPSAGDVRVSFDDMQEEIDSDGDSCGSSSSTGSEDSCASGSAPQSCPIDIGGPARLKPILSRSPKRPMLTTPSQLPNPILNNRGMLAGPLRLRLRKNLFVMETQIMMANAAYLSYVPGNVKEERLELKETIPLRNTMHTGSLGTNLDELDRKAHRNVKRGFFSRASAPVAPSIMELMPQPEYDDGTMFLVDPHEMATKFGYHLYRHITNREFNTHAIVLVSCTRVIVAFSGTRNVTNWGVNANFSRALLDEKLSRFEYELSDGAQTSEEGYSDDNIDSFQQQTGKTPRESNTQASDPHHGIRRSRSEEPLCDRGLSPGNAPVLGRTAENAGRSYGSIVHGKQSERYPDDEEEGSLSGFATSERVTMMAKAYARELMTFGRPKVHRGFIDAYMSLRRQVMGALVELYRGRPGMEPGRGSEAEFSGTAKSLPLFFCGHSLGGALATFASYEAARYFKRIGLSRRHDISCTTFGSPLIGNEAFKARYERLVETHWRFEIAPDPVPKVPLIFLNYVHVGVQVLIDQSGMLLIDPSFIEVKWWGQLTNLYNGYRHHIRASYCLALRAYCKLYKDGADDLSDRFWPFPVRFQTRGLFHQANW